MEGRGSAARENDAEMLVVTQTTDAASSCHGMKELALDDNASPIYTASDLPDHLLASIFKRVPPPLFQSVVWSSRFPGYPVMNHGELTYAEDVLETFYENGTEALARVDDALFFQGLISDLCYGTRPASNDPQILAQTPDASTASSRVPREGWASSPRALGGSPSPAPAPSDAAPDPPAAPLCPYSANSAYRAYTDWEPWDAAYRSSVRDLFKGPDASGRCAVLVLGAVCRHWRRVMQQHVVERCIGLPPAPFERHFPELVHLVLMSVTPWEIELITGGGRSREAMPLRSLSVADAYRLNDRALARIATLTSLRSLTLQHLVYATEPGLAALSTLTSLFYLEFSGRSLRDPSCMRGLATALRAMPALALLNLSGSYLSSTSDRGFQDHLVPALMTVTALVSLSMRSCALTVTDAPFLADLVARLPRLQELDLQENELLPAAGLLFARGIALSPAARLLREIRFDACMDTPPPRSPFGSDRAGAQQRELLATALPALSSLTSFSLADSHLSALDMNALLPAIASLTTLRVLELAGNEVPSSALGATLAALPYLGDLGLQGNMTSEHAELLRIDARAAFGPYVAAGHTSLRRLMLDEREVDAGTSDALFALLANSPAMAALSLDGCFEEAAPEVVGPLGTDFTALSWAWLNSLRSLQLCGCRAVGAAGVDMLARAFDAQGRLSPMTRLELAHVAYANEPDADADVPDSSDEQFSDALAVLLRCMPALEMLVLTGNPIGDEGVPAIAPALATLHGLRFLAISDCGLHGEGAEALAGSFRTAGVTALERLEVSGNVIGPVGGAHLARALAGASSLQTLDLSGCGIAGPGARALAACVPSMHFLRELELSGNELGEASFEADCEALWRALWQATTLRALSLDSNDLTDSDIKSHIKPLAFVLPDLAMLSLRGNPLSRSVVDWLHSRNWLSRDLQIATGSVDLDDGDEPWVGVAVAD